MSTWYQINDSESIALSEDGKSVEVLFDSDGFGNVYIEIPLELIVAKLDKFVRLKEC